jgi:dihydrofolate reductase
VSRLVYYAASTLDGFIADPDDRLDWLFKQDQDRHGSLNYDDFIAGIGAIVMGSTTYEWILDHEDGRWDYTVPAWVMTTRGLATPEGADVRFASGDVAPVHEAMLAAAAGRGLWVVGGGDLAGQFADAGLLDEVVVYLAPVVLGAGRPLLPRRLDLVLLETGRNRDFVTCRYRVDNRVEETQT